MFSRQHGEDNLLDWVQLVCLRDDAYDWAALRTGLGVLKDAWMRFQRKHPRAPEHVVAALPTLMSRIRPCADEHSSSVPCVHKKPKVHTPMLPWRNIHHVCNFQKRDCIPTPTPPPPHMLKFRANPPGRPKML